IHTVADWHGIRPLAPDRGAYGEQLDAVRALKRALPADVPFVQTVFLPLGVAGEMVEKPATGRDHLLGPDSAVFIRAREAIRDTLIAYVRAVLDAGADGLYFATTHFASHDMMPPEAYLRLVRPFHLKVIEAAREARFNVLHVCKSRNFLPELAQIPARAY